MKTGEGGQARAVDRAHRAIGTRTGWATGGGELRGPGACGGGVVHGSAAAIELKRLERSYTQR